MLSIPVGRLYASGNPVHDAARTQSPGAMVSSKLPLTTLVIGDAEAFSAMSAKSPTLGLQARPRRFRAILAGLIPINVFIAICLSLS
jgi:hypothetical protein